MRADAYFAIGKTHLVCQDYARVTAPSEPVLAAVSDGCSGSVGAGIYGLSRDRAKRTCACPARGCRLTWDQSSDTVPSHYRDGDATNGPCEGAGQPCQ